MTWPWRLCMMIMIFFKFLSNNSSSRVVFLLRVCVKCQNQLLLRSKQHLCPPWHCFSFPTAPALIINQLHVLTQRVCADSSSGCCCSYWHSEDRLPVCSAPDEWARKWSGEERCFTCRLISLLALERSLEPLQRVCMRNKSSRGAGREKSPVSVCA